MARRYKALRRVNSQRGSILVTVLGVLAVLLTVFLAAMTFSLTRYGHYKKQQSRLVAAHLSDAGVARSLSDLHNGDQSVVIDNILAPNGGSFRTTTMAWGPFILVTSDGTYANQTVTTSSLIGSSLPPLCSAAISVGNENYPFTVAGHTRIIGDINTGDLGVAMGRIKGEGVTSDDYHTGNVVVSANINIPPLDTTVLNQYLSEMHTRRVNTASVMEGSVLLRVADSRTVSQDESIYIENNLELNGWDANVASGIASLFVSGFVEIRGDTKISGLMEIVADGSIYVRDSAVLDNVLLYARDSIVFSGDAMFSGVAMAHRSIAVTGQASSAYPSSLVLLANDTDPESKGGVFLTSRGRMESVSFLSIANNDVDRKNYTLFLDSSAIFIGILWSEGLADIGGYVYGSIVAEQFLYELPPTTYVNWVRDLYVNRNALLYSPVLPVLTGDESQRPYRILRQDKLN
ncbi:MAG: hypothetical protein AB1483_12420 [Candidatus Zixiibacteriota bacterium]